MHFPLIKMTPADDFAAYERLAADNMRPEDFYTAPEMRELVASGQVWAWWIRNGEGLPIAWCALDNHNKDWEGACNALGLVVSPPYRHMSFALRMVRCILGHAGERPLTAYIQPGVKSERLMQPLGFRYVRMKDPWKLYVREKPAIPSFP